MTNDDDDRDDEIRNLQLLLRVRNANTIRYSLSNEFDRFRIRSLVSNLIKMFFFLPLKIHFFIPTKKLESSFAETCHFYSTGRRLKKTIFISNRGCFIHFADFCFLKGTA